MSGGLCVLGLGLIGGSLLRAQPGESFGWSPSEGTRAAAAGDGFEVLSTIEQALERAAAKDALVVLAAPLTAFGDMFRRIDAVAPTARVTDVGSVKGRVHEQAAEFAPRARFIGSHPMAGTQHSGWAAGSPELFQGAAWVTTMDEESEADVWADVAELALGLGCRVVPADPAAHDAAVARVSHLPHMLALTLAQVGEAGGALAMSLAASSFADGTRVAATRPELIRAMCETNRDALVRAVDDALGILGVARGSLASTGALRKLTEGGHDSRTVFESRGQDLEAVTLSGDDLVDQLLAVGSSGGHVSAIERTGDGLVVSAWFPGE